jgi:hypothetical protein
MAVVPVLSDVKDIFDNACTTMMMIMMMKIQQVMMNWRTCGVGGVERARTSQAKTDGAS